LPASVFDSAATEKQRRDCIAHRKTPQLFMRRSLRRRYWEEVTEQARTAGSRNNGKRIVLAAERHANPIAFFISSFHDEK
jgi:hypothetical protein